MSSSISPDGGDESDSSGSSSIQSVKLPPRVEVTVERLEGIIWSTSRIHENKEELNKSVPFVTAAVEFSGTCPNMKVYSANKYPHSKNPAVDSYFATLAPEYEVDCQKHPQATTNSEIRKITTCTTQDMGGTTTTTTTITTMTTSPTIAYENGQYPLVAKWQDEKRLGTASFVSDLEGGYTATHKAPVRKPHLSLTLPSSKNLEHLTLLQDLGSPCHHARQTAESSFEMVRSGGKCSRGQSGGTKEKHEVCNSKTFSTAATTVASSSHSTTDYVKANKPQDNLLDLGSLLDADSDEDDEEHNEQSKNVLLATTFQEETEIQPILKSTKSKELAVTAIVTEPSSGILGHIDTEQADAFSSFSWMTCGRPSPEIIEMRVRVIPEDDADDFQDVMELNSTSQAATQIKNELEGVAHLVLVDRDLEPGTTIMNLPLKIANRGHRVIQQDQTTSSMAPNICGASDYVTLASNAVLRVRITVLPQIKAPTPKPRYHHSGTQNNAEKDRLPRGQPAFHSRSVSMMIPMMKKLFQMPTSVHKRELRNKLAPQSSSQNHSLADQIRVALPEEITKKAETILGEWKRYSETWSWSRTMKTFSDAVSRVSVSSDAAAESETETENEHDCGAKNNAFYTSVTAARSCSSLSAATGTCTVDTGTETNLFAGLEQ